ncbi:peptidoglycan-binding domain-containing protein [Dermacoccaceae bacterium W4C1]
MKKLTGSTITARAAALAATATVAGALFATVPQAEAGDNRAPVRCNSITTTPDNRPVPGVDGKAKPCTIPAGSSGSSVLMLQRYLNLNIAPEDRIAEDGQYGPATSRVVAERQSAWNGYPCADDDAIRTVVLAVDGSWGPKTAEVMQKSVEWCGD